MDSYAKFLKVAKKQQDQIKMTVIAKKKIINWQTKNHQNL